METAEHQNLRQKIMAIQRDQSLTSQEKSRRIQQLMTGNFQPNSETNNEEKQKPVLNVSLTYYNEKDNILGCKHYIKNCKIKAPCCDQLFTCRRCHDDETDHKINRYLIEEMFCFFCSTIQPISNECNNCNKQMAIYFCKICKFFDGDKSKYIWHCDQCGLCRVGKKDTHEHCNECHTCMPKDHKVHIDRVLDCNCPICGENLFLSTQTSVFS